MITFRKIDASLCHLSYCTVEGLHLQLVDVKQNLNSRIEEVRGQCFTSLNALYTFLSKEEKEVRVLVKGASDESLHKLLQKLVFLFHENKGEESLLSVLEEKVTPWDWVKQPKVNQWWVACYKSSVHRHYERFVRLLLEKGIDPAYLMNVPDPLLEAFFSSLSCALIDCSLQREISYPAALPLLDYMKERCAESQAHREFLSGVCSTAFARVFEVSFAKGAEAGINKDKEVDVLEKICMFAERYSLQFRFPQNLSQGEEEPLFSYAIKNGALRVFKMLVEEKPSLLSSRKCKGFGICRVSPFLLAIQYRQDQIFNFLLDRSQWLFPEERKMRKRLLSSSMQFDYERAFDLVLSYTTREELSEGIRRSWKCLDEKYIGKLLTYGVKVDWENHAICQMLFALLCIVRCTKEEQDFIYLRNLLLESCDLKRKDVLFAESCSYMESLHIPAMLYRAKEAASDAPWYEIYGGEGVQNRYDEEYRKTLAGAVFLIHDHMNFADLLQYFSERRGKMAIISGQDNWDFFGRWRTDEIGLYTLIKGRYRNYLEKMKQKIENNELSGYLYANFADGGEGIDAQIVADIEGEEVLLTKTERDRWIHTESVQRDRVIAFVETLYQQVCSATLPDPEDSQYLSAARLLVRKILRIHWWMAHATPYCRGSAAISEMLVRSLFLYHKISFTSWRPGVFVDCEALIEGDCEKFCANYSEFMEPGYSQAFLEE